MIGVRILREGLCQTKMDTTRRRQNDNVHIAAKRTEMPRNSSTSSTGTVVFMFVSLLIDLLGFTVILPLIPSILDYYSTQDEVLISHCVCMCVCACVS